jgi:flagellar protein FliS
MANAIAAYRETRVKTASQGQLVVMLYDEAVKQLDMSLDLMGPDGGQKPDPSKIQKINKSVLKTQAIISELQASLNFEAGGDIARNLFSLYAWFNQELVQSNINQDPKPMTSVRNMMNDLRGAWAEIASKTSTVGMRSNMVLDIAG